jgi:hypothetical protein
MIEEDDRTVMNDDVIIDKEEICSACGGPLHDEVFIWDDNSMEYVLLGGNGGPKRECRLTDEDYKLIDQYDMENETEIFLT